MRPVSFRYRRLVVLLAGWSLAAVSSLVAPSAVRAQGTEAWLPLSMPPREDHTLIFDQPRGRQIIFGGFDGQTVLGDVWMCDGSPGAHWSSPTLSGGPGPRRGHGAVYDPVGDRMLIIGGRDATFLYNDVWQLTLGTAPTWSRVLTAGSPSATTGFATVYDPVGQRVLRIGGSDGDFFENAVYSLGLTGTPTWSQLTVLGTPPSPRDGLSAVYDAPHQRVLVFGGRTRNQFGTIQYLNDVWSLDLASTPTWQSITTSGTPPSPRAFHQSAYDPVRNELRVIGGRGTMGVANDVQFGLSLGETTPGWIQFYVLDYCPPSVFRASAGSAYDAEGARWLINGGNDGTTPLCADSWHMDFRSSSSTFFWSPFAPQPLSLPAMAYDAIGERAVVYGGLDPVNSPGNTYSFKGTNVAVWDSLPPDYPGLGGHSLTYVPRLRQMFAFGGLWGGVFCGAQEMNEVRMLHFAPGPAWTTVTPSGTAPTERWDHSAIYDPLNDRIIVFGGFQSFVVGNPSNQVFSLSLAPLQWTQLAPSGVPPSPRGGHRAVYDAVGRRMLVFGGIDGAGTSNNEVWALDLTGGTSWSLLSPGGTAPLPRSDHSAVFDSRRGRMLVYGGQTSAGVDGEAWALALEPSLQWIRLTVPGGPPARSGHAAVYDSTLDRMLVYGGRRASSALLGDVWALRLGAVVDVPAVTPTAIRLGPVTPNPSARGMGLSLELPSAERVRVSVLDLAGRRVRVVEDQQRNTGRHWLTWDGRGVNGDFAAPGVYMLRVRVGEKELSRKLILTR